VKANPISNTEPQCCSGLNPENGNYSTGMQIHRWFFRGGIEFHYTDQGSGEPVVLIHGSQADYSY